MTAALVPPNPELNHNIQVYQKKLTSTIWEEMPQYFVTSATSSDGKEDVLKYIDGINKGLEDNL